MLICFDSSQHCCRLVADGLHHSGEISNSMLICFDSSQHCCCLVADGLATDNVDVTVMCQIIIIGVNCHKRRKNCLCKSFIVS